MSKTNLQSAQQKKNIRLTVISILIIMVVFFGLFLNNILTPRVMTIEELQHNGVIMFDEPRIVKPFTLIDQNEKTFTLERTKGKLNLIFFGFTHCPDICPTTLAELARVHNDLPESIQNKVQIILVSLDPSRDTAEHLKPYIEYFNPDFIGLTGQFNEIMRLTGNVNVAFNKVLLDNDYTIDHTSHVVILNEHGHYSGFIKAPLPTSQLPRIIESTLTQKL